MIKIYQIQIGTKSVDFYEGTPIEDILRRVEKVCKDELWYQEQLIKSELSKKMSKQWDSLKKR